MMKHPSPNESRLGSENTSLCGGNPTGGDAAEEIRTGRGGVSQPLCDESK